MMGFHNLSGCQLVAVRYLLIGQDVALSGGLAMDDIDNMYLSALTMNGPRLLACKPGSSRRYIHLLSILNIYDISLSLPR